MASPTPAYPTPTHRRLKVFAFDPMLGRSPLHRITLEVPYEPLKRGPRGTRVHVVDFDGARQTYYDPVNLDDPLLLLQDGLDPTESDPRFHQQMVYAVAMKVLENFDIALGRRFHFHGQRPLVLMPHAFHGANAYFESRRKAVLFGYFPADRKNPGPNLPEQPVFSCLSHDIIAHEVTHAITNRLREYFLEPTNHDVLAFHEAFSDIVAIFQHFTFPEILRQAVQDSQADLRRNTSMVNLAQQFGYATGEGNALRSAVDRPDAGRLRRVTEPHERGSILVGAVFEAFFRTYQNRIQDLLRIASGGTGQLPSGAIHPDLVNRLADEASTVAQSTLRMCIRAFDYLPPVDVTFGDYLRALVTADFELNPRDVTGLRRAMVDSFRERGIYPEDVNSLSEDSLRWERADPSGEMESGGRLATIINSLASDLIQQASNTSRNTSLDPLPPPPQGEQQSFPTTPHGKLLQGWALANAGLVELNANEETECTGYHPVFRVGRDGQLLVEVVLQFAQRVRDPGHDYGGIPLRGGSTVVVQANGRIRYVISKPLQGIRIDRQRAFVADLDAREPLSMWKDAAFQPRRLQRMMSLRRLHMRTHP